jgi:hypothetical protein
MGLTLGFDTDDLEALAQQLQAALGVKLFRSESPMDGTHYSSRDFATLAAAVMRGEAVSPEETVERLHLRRNDPEPGYLSPEYAGRKGCNLTILDSAQGLAQVQAQLERAGLAFHVLKAKASSPAR